VSEGNPSHLLDSFLHEHNFVSPNIEKVVEGSLLASIDTFEGCAHLGPLDLLLSLGFLVLMAPCVKVEPPHFLVVVQKR